ncbi:periplasmic protease [Idiomarina sp. A28L]|uniref:S41 family peptidase n=1 Tax=Idiomarina sp. A28L TaxID=1036674 RepID=UPI000213874D|nr:S41 family peptidase [Idiomarina sp. A28L]EGN76422.1 periplasmic protease [Idiomarina sp. A28L]
MCASKLNRKRSPISRHILWAATLPLFLAGCGSEDVFTGEPSLITNAQCSTTGQNQQLLNFMNDRYLWKEDMNANVNPANYDSIYAMLDAIIAPQDRFSFIITEQEYQDRFVNAEFFGFGFGIRDRVDLGLIELRYVYDDSAADLAGMNRGDAIIAVDGVTMETWYSRISSGQATYADIFGGNSEGVERDITFRKPDGREFTETLRKGTVEANTIMATERLEINNKDVGYFVFDTFVNRSADDLNSAYDQLLGVDELIIDLRYNSGGLVRVANQLSSQAAWDSVENEIFLTFQYNENYDNEDYFFDLGPGIERLNLNRVYVLTTGASCSSSELVINSLSPFVEVVTIGEPTCGKPVGQQPGEICDKVVFAITFQTVNAEGFGDYFDGLPVTCAASDIIVGDWGDPADPLLAEATYHLTNGQCSAAATGALQSVEAQRPPLTEDPILSKWRQEF